MIGPALKTLESQPPQPSQRLAGVPEHSADRWRDSSERTAEPGPFLALDITPPVLVEEADDEAAVVDVPAPPAPPPPRATTPRRRATTAARPVRTESLSNTAPAADVERVAKKPVVGTGNLEIVFKNRLQNADLSVWVDEEKIWERTVTAPKSVFKRAVGRNVFALLELSEGTHVIDIRVIGAEGKVDIVRRTEGEFFEGKTRRLKVSVVPPKKLKLSWAGEAEG